MTNIISLQSATNLEKPTYSYFTTSVWIMYHFLNYSRRNHAPFYNFGVVITPLTTFHPSTYTRNKRTQNAYFHNPN